MPVCGKRETDLRAFARAALEAATLSYLQAHFHDGVASVFAVTGSSKFFVQIVANKYNPSNYWCVISCLS